MPRSVAMKLTGHKTESVLRRYAIVSEADLREGVAKLARLHESTSSQQPQPSFRSPADSPYGPPRDPSCQGHQTGLVACQLSDLFRP